MRERHQGVLQGMRYALAMLEDEVRAAKKARNWRLEKALVSVLSRMQNLKHLQAEVFMQDSPKRPPPPQP